MFLSTPPWVVQFQWMFSEIDFIVIASSSLLHMRTTQKLSSLLYIEHIDSESKILASPTSAWITNRKAARSESSKIGCSCGDWVRISTIIARIRASAFRTKIHTFPAKNYNRCWFRYLVDHGQTIQWRWPGSDVVKISVRRTKAIRFFDSEWKGESKHTEPHSNGAIAGDCGARLFWRFNASYRIASPASEMQNKYLGAFVSTSTSSTYGDSYAFT